MLYALVMLLHAGIADNSPLAICEHFRRWASLDFYARYEVALYIGFTVGFAAIGALIFWRKSDDRMALFASLTLIMFPAGFNSSQLATLPSAWSFPVHFLAFLGNISIFLFFYLFPSGRFVPR